MGNPEMRVLNFKSTSTPRYRIILATCLFVLCIPIFFYRLVPSFTHASDAFIADVTSRIRAQSSSGGFCTKEIGNAQCCALYLAASPCVDECMKQHVDRLTFTLTQEYDECADTCLATYSETCPVGSANQP
jgi:hypothetical protein